MEKNMNVDELLQEGITLMINQWPALNLAIQNGWGQKNRKKINSNNNLSDDELKAKLITSLTNYILEFDVIQQDIEQFLLDYMDDNFFTVIEDNSEKFLAKLSIELFLDLENNRSTQKLQEIKELSKKFEKAEVIGQNQNGSEESSSDDEEEDEDEKAPDLEENNKMEAEEQFQQTQEDKDDGFIMVQTKTKKK